MEKIQFKNRQFNNKLFSLSHTFSSNQLIILSSPSLAEETFLLLKEELSPHKLYLFPHTETLPYDFFSPSTSIKNQRLTTLSKIISKKQLKQIFFRKKHQCVDTMPITSDGFRVATSLQTRRLVGPWGMRAGG